MVLECGGSLKMSELEGWVGRFFWGMGWSIVVSAFPELSSRSCSNANLYLEIL